MPYVIQIVGLVSGRRHPYDGKYVYAYDPSSPSEPAGVCLLSVVAAPKRAKRYASMEAARKEWMRVDTRKPVRSDGRPNMPLTAFTISIVPVPGDD